MPHFKNLLFFIVAILATIIALELLKAVPIIISQDEIKQYRSIAEVKRVLHTSKIILPSYFPQDLKWPPKEIYAQKKPFPMVLIHFTSQSTKDVVLSLQQTLSQDVLSIDSRIEPEKISNEQEIKIKNTTALLTQGYCSNGETCNKITWDQDGHTFKVVTKSTIWELLKIAESMTF